MAVVNTNVNATVAQNALVRNEREMNTAMERLSHGPAYQWIPRKMMPLDWRFHRE